MNSNETDELIRDARRHEASRAAARAFLAVLRERHPDVVWREVRRENELAD